MLIRINKYLLLIAGAIALSITLFSMRAHITGTNSIPSTSPHENAISKVIALIGNEILPGIVQKQIAPRRLSPVPQVVKAVYLTAWSAADQKTIENIIALTKTTELNGVVIDIKDYTGHIMFATQSDAIKKLGSQQIRIPDFGALVQKLHDNNIYVIARIAAFQDVYLAEHRPDLAVKNAHTGAIWRDRKNLAWVDPASKEVWGYLVDVSQQATNLGVDELNFDYIRFPSDGDVQTLQYPMYDATKISEAKQIKAFFAYLHDTLKPTGVMLSVDLFGLTTVSLDDMGIGQYLEYALPYFDYICPMVYPSHYSSGLFGYKNPALYPYEIVFESMKSAQTRREKFIASSTPLLTASSSPEVTSIAKNEKNNTMKQTVARFRPWLQAFDLGTTYTPSMVRKQIQAVYDANSTAGWYLWDPANTYDPAIFLKK